MSGQNPLGIRVKQVWQESGRSQEDFASSVGLSRTGLTNIMNGDADPKASTVQRIAQVSGRRVGWFYDGQDPAPTSSTAPEPAPEPQAHAPPGVEARLERVEDTLAALLAEQTETNRLLRQAIARGSGRATSGRRGNGDDPTVGSVA